MKKKYNTPCAETYCTMSAPLLRYSVNRLTDGGTKTVGDTDDDDTSKKGSLWNQLQNN